VYSNLTLAHGRLIGKAAQEGGTMPNHGVGTPARTSERVLLRIPIRVEGKDALGNAFEETTYTLVVNRSGGLIVVSHPLQPGTVINITNLSSQISCSFQVVTRAARSLSGTPEWGVKCLEPELEIWGVHFPTRTEEPAQPDLIHVLLECQQCFSREMAALTVQQYRRLVTQSSLSGPCPKCATTRDWKFAFIEVGLEEILPGLPAPSASGLNSQTEAERRQDKRLAVKLPLGVRLPDGSEEASTTENISKSGLCFACGLEMHVGERVYVRVGLDSPEEQRDIPARIMWRRPVKEKGRSLYGAKLERGE
jgi:hypothetical protein